ncbi:MAG: nucleoside triphosphate pyrophosphohydrolase [Acidimicrobiia bacterium]
MITVVGVGPGDLDRVSPPVLDLLQDPGRTIIARTNRHPALAQLAEKREVVFCDDLYDSATTFEEVYTAIAGRVVEAAGAGPVVYAVPGSPLIGEFAVRQILASHPEVTIVPGESFVDAVLARMGYDPMDRGLQILNGHHLPDPLVLDKPTVIGHLDRPEVLAEACARVSRVLAGGAEISVLVDLGSARHTVVVTDPDRVDPSLAGLRTSLFVDAPLGGLMGAVATMRRLREECPWDREQTHQSLVKNLVEECFELIDAIERLEDGDTPDWQGYAGVEDELGDLLLQVLFHEAIARENGVFDIDHVAEVLRQKLVRRHPHVFAEAEVDSAAEVKKNWDRIKEEEAGAPSASVLDGVPAGMPSLHRASKVQNRAAKVGFDWEEPSQVMGKVREELAELEEAMAHSGDTGSELGDVLFSLVNLARHLGDDAELVLRGATRRFEDRFRHMESEGPLDGLDIDELNRRWERAKDA